MTNEQVQQEFEVVSRLQAGYYFDPPESPEPTDWDHVNGGKPLRPYRATAERSALVLAALDARWRGVPEVIQRTGMAKSSVAIAVAGALASEAGAAAQDAHRKRGAVCVSESRVIEGWGTTEAPA
jgi:hypothetical protein